MHRAALLVLAGATAASVLPALWRRLRRPLAAAAGPADASRSTTSSAGGGVAAYESRKAVDEYLQFHFGKPEEVMPYDCGPKVRPAGQAGGRGRRGCAGGPCCCADIAAAYCCNARPCRTPCGSPRRLRCCASGTAPRCWTSRVRCLHASLSARLTASFADRILLSALPADCLTCRCRPTHWSAPVAGLAGCVQGRGASPWPWTLAVRWGAPALRWPVPSLTCWASTFPSTLSTRPMCGEGGRMRCCAAFCLCLMLGDDAF